MNIKYVICTDYKHLLKIEENYNNEKNSIFKFFYRIFDDFFGM